MNKIEQIKSIESITQKLNEVIKELAILKESIAVSEYQTSQTDLTVKKLLSELKKRNRGAASRIRHAFIENNITSIEQLLKLRPRNVAEMNGVGSNTVYHLREVLEDLGIIW